MQKPNLILKQNELVDNDIKISKNKKMLGIVILKVFFSLNAIIFNIISGETD